MSWQQPSLAELQELIDQVRQHAPEHVATMDYLLSACRRLSLLTLENLLNRPEDEKLTLAVYHRFAIFGTLPDDLAVVTRRRGFQVTSEKQRQRLLQLQKLIDRLRELEARQKIERFFSLR